MDSDRSSTTSEDDSDDLTSHDHPSPTHRWYDEDNEEESQARGEVSAASKSHSPPPLPAQQQQHAKLHQPAEDDSKPVAGPLKAVPGCVSVDTRNVSQYMVGMTVEGMAQGRVTGEVMAVHTTSGASSGPGTIVVRLTKGVQVKKSNSTGSNRIRSDGSPARLVPKRVHVVEVGGSLLFVKIDPDLLAFKFC